MNCKICDTKNIKSLHNHIQWQHNDYTTKKYYDEFLRTTNEGLCVCGKETRFWGFTLGYAKTCGYSCHNKQKFAIPGYLEKHRQRCSQEMSERNKRNWQNPVYREKMLAILKSEQEKLGRFKINKCEHKLLLILQKFDPEFEYAGDWSVFIRGKSPDFINKKKRLIVEHLGTYWHRNDTTKTLQKRADLFKQDGFDTLYVWEKELKNTYMLEDKINSFLQKETL